MDSERDRATLGGGKEVGKTKEVRESLLKAFAKGLTPIEREREKERETITIGSLHERQLVRCGALCCLSGGCAMRCCAAPMLSYLLPACLYIERYREEGSGV